MTLLAVASKASVEAADPATPVRGKRGGTQGSPAGALLKGRRGVWGATAKNAVFAVATNVGRM
jgi:hypothetical protein